MSAATWTIIPLPQFGPRARQGVLDCPHGTTRCGIAPAAGGVDLDDDGLLALVLARHAEEESCDCADALTVQLAGRQAHL